MYSLKKSYKCIKTVFVLGCVVSLGWFSSPVMAHETSVRLADEDTTVVVVAEVQPQFENMNQWLSENLQYPEEAHNNQIEGRVFVSFVIEKDGSVSHVAVVRSAHPLLDAEALRVISNMPKWKPAMTEGKPVRFAQTLPITFKMAPQEVEFTFEQYLQNLKEEQEVLAKGEGLPEEEQAQRVEAFKAQLGDDATLYKMLLDKSKNMKGDIDSILKAQTKFLKLKKNEAKELTKIYENEIDAKIKLIEGLGTSDFVKKFVANEIQMRKLEMNKVLEIQKLLGDRFQLYFENCVLPQQ